MSTLPQQQTFPQLQTKWASILNPIVQSPILQGRLITDISLPASTMTSINHGLGRKLVGWIIVGISGDASVYDTQSSNQMPQLTLNLVSNNAVILSLWVF